MFKMALGGVVLGFVLIVLGGCVQLPGNVDVQVGNPSSSPRVDSTRIPPTSSHEEARQELQKAYGYIRGLERKVNKLEEDKSELKAQVSQLKKRLKRYED